MNHKKQKPALKGRHIIRMGAAHPIGAAHPTGATMHPAAAHPIATIIQHKALKGRHI